MTNRARQVLVQALELDRQERAALAASLLNSLEDGEDDLGPEEWDALWQQEVERRLRELDEGRVEALPAEVVMAELRARVDAAKKSS